MNGIFRIRSCVGAVATFTWVASSCFLWLATAQAQPVPSGLSRADVQRISNDLSRNGMPDFFKKGRENLEREIRLMDRRTLLSMENLLKVSGSPSLPLELTPSDLTQPSPLGDR
jgi:flagellar biosynthesis/type III secretory pathway M-ring protein FliF/YscJ